MYWRSHNVGKKSRNQYICSENESKNSKNLGKKNLKCGPPERKIFSMGRGHLRFKGGIYGGNTWLKKRGTSFRALFKVGSWRGLMCYISNFENSLGNVIFFQFFAILCLFTHSMHLKSSPSYIRLCLISEYGVLNAKQTSIFEKEKMAPAAVKVEFVPILCLKLRYWSKNKDWNNP